MCILIEGRNLSYSMFTQIRDDKNSKDFHAAPGKEPCKRADSSPVFFIQHVTQHKKKRSKGYPSHLAVQSRTMPLPVGSCIKMAVEESGKSAPAKDCISDSIAKQTSTGC